MHNTMIKLNKKAVNTIGIPAEKEPSFKIYMTKEPPLNRVLVLEDLDFCFCEKDLKQIKKMWKEEVGIKYMAEYFNRDPDEILLAIIHLAREDKIGRRKRGLLK